MLVDTARRIPRSLVRRAARIAGRAYIAGEQLSDAEAMGHYLAARGYAITFGYWNRVGEDPERIREHNLAALESLRTIPGDAYLSVKVPPMHFDPERFSNIAIKAREVGVPLHLDSHRHNQADATIRLALASMRYVPTGLTVPARWRRSLADVEQLTAAGVTVRAVKGQWPTRMPPSRTRERPS